MRTIYSRVLPIFTFLHDNRVIMHFGLAQPLTLLYRVRTRQSGGIPKKITFESLERFTVFALTGLKGLLTNEDVVNATPQTTRY